MLASTSEVEAVFKKCCERYSGNPIVKTLFLVSPNKEVVVSESGYVRPLQDLLEGMERQQLAGGISKNGTATNRGHISPPLEKHWAGRDTTLLVTDRSI